MPLAGRQLQHGSTADAVGSSAAAAVAGLAAGPGATAGASSRKRRGKHYPPSWGCPADRMRMKKRVMCVYDGPRRLWKDDMMLDREYEVRVPMPMAEGAGAGAGAGASKAYVTDLDIMTMRRAEALHGTTEEERGPWRPDNVVDAVPGAVYGARCAGEA